jgi:hypothetical protein
MTSSPVGLVGFLVLLVELYVGWVGGQVGGLAGLYVGGRVGGLMVLWVGGWWCIMCECVTHVGATSPRLVLSLALPARTPSTLTTHTRPRPSTAARSCSEPRRHPAGQTHRHGELDHLGKVP